MRSTIEVRAIGQYARSGSLTLRDISIAIGHGELVAIIGGSGSGKTTLLDAMSGLRPPANGTVSHRTPGVGYLPSGDAVHPDLPLGVALRYAAALRAVPDQNAAIEQALKATDLSARADAPVATLRPGERKRAGLAVELLSRPALLFLDDPTAGLDPAQGTEVMRLLRRLCDDGVTVVLTTQNPLDADRCDKIAVLADGGHLAFFGTPDAARDYFAADSLDEIYERLAGLGDPAAAWSRRFFHFSRTIGGYSPNALIPAQPGPAHLLPDTAGPHSAGPVTAPLAGDVTAPLAADDPAFGSDADDDSPNGYSPATPAAARRRRRHPIRQWAILTRRNAELLARSPLARVVCLGAPIAAILAIAVLSATDAFSPAAALPWAVFGGCLTGLCYGLPQVNAEFAAIRAERFGGQSAAAYLVAKAATLLPPLALADALILGVAGLLGRLPAGFAPAFLTVLLASAASLALALLISAAVPHPERTPLAIPAVCLPPAVLAAALLTLLDQPSWSSWLPLGMLAIALFAVTAVIVARRAPRSAAVEHRSALVEL